MIPRRLGLFCLTELRNPYRPCNVRMARPGLDGAQAADKFQQWCLEGQQKVGLLPFFVVLRNSKTQAESGGRAPRLRLTLLLAQKSKQKRACAALGMSGSTADVSGQATSIRIVLNDQEPTLPPQEPRLLRASPFVEVCVGRGCFGFSLVNHTARSGPLTQGRIPITAGC